MTPPPCEEKVCASKSDALRRAMQGNRQSARAAKPQGSSHGSSDDTGSGDGGGGGSEMGDGGGGKKEGGVSEAVTAACPADRDELGRQSWTLLHTLAAYYPEKPTGEQAGAARSLMHAMGVLYPCSHCAADLRTALVEAPPRVESRSQFCIWMCEAHNRVNRIQGKQEFPCTMDKLDLRWRDGGEDCDTLE